MTQLPSEFYPQIYLGLSINKMSKLMCLCEVCYPTESMSQFKYKSRVQS